MTDTQPSPAEETGRWADIFTGRLGVYTLVLGLGMGLFAINQFVVATIMPTVLTELGGVKFYSWAFSLFAVGAIVGAIGGSPIEFWLPPGHVNNSLCGVDTPACDDGGKNKYTDSDFFERMIKPFMPYTLGTVLWDQAERDVHCLPAIHGLLPENTTARYACLERQLLSSWREGFNEKTTRPFLFIAVQVMNSAVAIASRLIIIY